MRGICSDEMFLDRAHAEAGRFYDAYYYFFTRIKENRHAMTE